MEIKGLVIIFGALLALLVLGAIGLKVGSGLLIIVAALGLLLWFIFVFQIASSMNSDI